MRLEDWSVSVLREGDGSWNWSASYRQATGLHSSILQRFDTVHAWPSKEQAERDALRHIEGLMQNEAISGDQLALRVRGEA